MPPDAPISDAEFDRLIAKAMDELPQRYIRGLVNVAILMADEPSAEQRRKMKLDDNSLLLGLYEGVPLPERGGSPAMLPDKITLFKYPLLAVSENRDAFFGNIKRTLWHEIAHYYGLNHRQIDALQQKSRQKP